MRASAVVAAGILPAVEPGVPPGGKKLTTTGLRAKYSIVVLLPAVFSGRQDAALHGRRDARRYKGASVTLDPIWLIEGRAFSVVGRLSAIIFIFRRSVFPSYVHSGGTVS